MSDDEHENKGFVASISNQYKAKMNNQQVQVIVRVISGLLHYLIQLTETVNVNNPFVMSC